MVAGLPVPAGAAPDGPGDGPRFGTVPFRPITGAFPYGQLARTTLRLHRVVVVPLYSSRKPSMSDLRIMTSETAAFWAREVPGLSIRFTVTPAVRAPAAVVCDTGSAWSLAQRRAGLGAGSLATGRHLFAWAPECGTTGVATQAPGFGRIYVGMTGSGVLAHEFGHNLGLIHADVLVCRRGGVVVSLSRSCTEYEYADVDDVMGAGVGGTDLLADVRTGGLVQALLTGRVVKVPVAESSTANLARRGTAARVAAVRSAYGTILLTVTDRERLSTERLGVQARLATGNGSGLLHLPGWDGALAGSDSLLELGDVWDVPGTRLRAVVTGLTPDGGELGFVPRGAPARAPAAPVISAPADSLASASGPWQLTWSAGTADDTIAHVVTVDGEVAARIAGPSAQAVMGPATTGQQVRVWAVTGQGARTASEPLSVIAVEPEVNLVSSLGDPAIDEEPIARGPFTVSWAPTPAAAVAAIASWEVDYGQGATLLPVDARSVVADPAALGVAPGTRLSIEVTGLDGRGRAVVGGSYVVTYQT